MSRRSSRSNSPLVSSESESDDGLNIEDITAHSDQGFLPYDEELEPLATEEEASEYNATIAREEELERQYQQRYTGEVEVNSWYSIF